MRKLLGWLVLTVIILIVQVLAPSVSRAQPDMHEMDGAVPRNVHWGLDLLRRDSFEEAEKQILSGSRIPADGGLAGGFRSYRQQSGQFQGFFVVSSQTITPRLRIIYIALQYEMAPYFLRLTVYRTPDGWVVLRRPVWLNGEDDLEPLLANRPTAPTEAP